MRRDDFPLEKRTMNFFKGDFETLQEMFPGPGASKIIRDMVHRFIARCKAKAEQTQNPITDTLEAPDE